MFDISKIDLEFSYRSRRLLTQFRTHTALFAFASVFLFCMGIHAQSSPHPTVSAMATPSSGSPLWATCTIKGPQIVDSQGPTGGVTFTDLTANEALGTVTLGTPTQVLFSSISSNNNSGAYPKLVASGDFNKDGKLDSAGFTILDNNQAVFSIFLGNGDGTFQAPINTSASASAVGGVAAGDFNEDGNLDVAFTIAGPATPTASYMVLEYLGNGDGTFQAPKTIPVGNGPAAIVAHDFYGSGHLDLAIANTKDNTVSILKGNGDGSFQSPIAYSVGAGPTSLAIADFNADGYIDIAAANTTDGTISVLMGNGNGTFQAAQTYTASTGVNYIAAADLNGDGRPDIVLTSSRTDAFITMLNNGEGALQAPVLFAYYNSASISSWPYAAMVPYAIATGDFNGDGILDVSIAGDWHGDLRDWYPEVLIAFGNGDGTFASAYNIEPSSLYDGNPSNGSLLSGDFDNDGISDLATVGVNNEYVLENRKVLATASGTYELTEGSTATHNLQCSYAGDANYAGSTSGIVSATMEPYYGPNFSLPSGTYSTPESVSITVFDNSGSYKPTIYYTTDGTPPSSSSIQYTGPIVISGQETLQAIVYEAGFLPSPVSSASYTLQARTPAITPASGTYAPGTTVTITNPSSQGSIYYTTDGTTPSTSSTLYTGPFSIASTATVQAIVAVPTLLNSPIASASYTITSVITPTPVITPGSGTYPSSPSVTITDTTSGAVIYYTTNGKTPTSTSKIYTGPVSVTGVPFLTTTVKAIAISPGDAQSSVATVNYTVPITNSSLATSGSDPYTLTCSVTGAAISGIQGPTGTITFSDTTASQTLGTMPLGAPTHGTGFTQSSLGAAAQIAIGDFNNDGIPDLALGRGTQVSIELGNGDGTFTASPIVSGNGWEAIGPLAAGDFNGDGKLDLIFMDGSIVRVMYGDGSGGFAAPVSAYQPIDPSVFGGMAVSDFNDDGLSDLVVTYSNTGSVAILLGSNLGLSESSSITFTTTSPNAPVVAGDFNGDGKPDFAVATSKEVSVFLGDGNGSFQTPQVSPLSFAPIGLAAADFNRDGKLDLTVGGTYAPPGSSAYPGAWLLLGNGDGTFQNPSSPASTWKNGTTPSSVIAGDFNGDGYPDVLLVGNSNTHYLSALSLGNGNGTLQQPVVYSIGGVGLGADLNADGLTDLVLSESQVLNANGSISSLTEVALSYQQAAATATLANATVTAGTTSPHNLECSYPGDSTYQPSVSSPVAVNFSAAASPFFSLLVGNYTSAQTVSITDSTPNTSFYYTDDGSTPTLSSTRYTAPIPVTNTVTLKAIAAGTTHVPSPVSEVTYTITNAPTFSIPGGTYATQQTVALSDSTAGSTIYYTTDGSTPTKSSAVYAAPITIIGNKTLSAMALSPGYLFSTVSQSTYNTPLEASSTALQSSATSGDVNQKITLTATVKGANPTGSVTFSANGQNLGNATLSNGVASLQVSFATAGTYSVTATYSGDTSNTSSTSTATNIVIAPLAPGTSSTALQSSATSGDINQKITLTATVKGTNPTGSVTFSANSQSLGKATLSNGTASLQASFTTAGTYSVTADYSGDANNAPSTSTAVNIVVAASDFAVVADPTSQSITPGQSATFTFTVTSMGGYSGAVKFSCGTLPSEATCSFSPDSVTSTGNESATAKLTITTTAPTTSAKAVPIRPFNSRSFDGACALAGLLGLLLTPRRIRRWNRLLRAAACALLFVSIWMPLSGCGGGSNENSTPGNTGTPAGSYSISVNAADAASNLAHNIKVTLTVN